MTCSEGGARPWGWRHSAILADVSAPPYTGHMTPKLADYIEAGYSLTPDERLEAARMLRLSVDQDADADSADIDSAWRDEIGSRVGDILAGEVQLVDADETYRLLSAELASKRR